MQRNRDQVLTEWLVLHAQGGNARAMDQLLKHWYPKLLRYASNQIENREAAKDVVQETMMIVARRIGRLRDPAAFPKWTYQILQRRGVDYLRKEIRNRRNTDASPRCDEALDGDPMGDLDVRMTVNNALQSLQSDSYQIVHLRYLLGLDLREIANVVGIPTGTVKSRLHSARAQLRTLLEEKA